MSADCKTSEVNWSQTVSMFLHPRVVTMLFFGFSAGIPILLIFSSLSLWLREAGVERSVVTYFSWAALGYSFKFVWAPLVDRLPLPGLTHTLGRRRAWILVAQLMVIVSIILMASSNPGSEGSLTYLAISSVLLGFSSATQDIVIDAYRIESAAVRLQAMMSSSYIAGYRTGMLVAGAGTLYLADGFGSTLEHYVYQAWQKSYFIMAGCMLIGVITTLLISEPDIDQNSQTTNNRGINNRENFQIILLFICCVSAFVGFYYFSGTYADQLKISLSVFFGNKPLAATIIEFLRLVIAISASYLAARTVIFLRCVPGAIISRLYLNPVKDFFSRYGIGLSVLLLGLIGCYRISDIVLGVISNVFYQDMGYSKSEIATASKLFGFWMSLIGGFIGGIIAIRIGVVRVLLIGAILAATTNLLFAFLAMNGYSIFWLYIVIAIDNLSGGIAAAAFVAFLSALTNVKFSATQYAIFSSLMTLIPKILGGYSGGMVDSIGYSQFFILTAILGLPVIIIIILVSRKVEL